MDIYLSEIWWLISYINNYFFQIYKWLTTNCYIHLGDRVWKQILGIPMGFFCSSLWCKLYLLSYEIKFIQRLAKLGQTKIMSIFKYVLGTLLTYVGSMWRKLKFLTHYNPKIWIIHYIYTPSEVSQFSTSSP